MREPSPATGSSPYASGGGGVTLERKVAVQYLAHLLTGDGAAELGDGRRVLSVEFQQAPDHPVDDLVVRAAHRHEPAPSLVLALAVRRAPRLVQSDPDSQTLIRQFVQASLAAPPAPPEQRLGLVVAGAQGPVKQLGKLADHAAGQTDGPGFFRLIQTPGRFNQGDRDRLDHVGGLVRAALCELSPEPDTSQVQQRTWEVLSVLTVLTPGLESPDSATWSGIANELRAVVPNSDLDAAAQLRDRLLVLAGDYSSKSARVDRKSLRRDAHAFIDTGVRRYRRAWQRLTHLHERALKSVRYEIVSSDGTRSLTLDRHETSKDLGAAAQEASAVVVTGLSGVGKSALTLQHFASSNYSQSLCVNLRQVPDLSVELEGLLDSPLATVLAELSDPQRTLVVDGADAVAEGKRHAFRHLIDAAKEADVKIVAVASLATSQSVVDMLADCIDGDDVKELFVESLTDGEVDQVIASFPELGRLGSGSRSRELLRRLVVVDLLVRSSVAEVPVTDADAMRQVWTRLVRGTLVAQAGSPTSRAAVMLQLARAELMGGDRLSVVSELDHEVVEGLRRDGLFLAPDSDSSQGYPEFAHDELRRYAIAQLLLLDDMPTAELLRADAPRWSLSAAQLACQAWLAHSENGFISLQRSFDELVERGLGSRWGDVPGEALLKLADATELLRDAWPELRADGDAGLKRLVRLIDQRLRDHNMVVDIAAVEPIIALLLEDPAPWRFGAYVKELLVSWLRAHVISSTAAGHPLRAHLRERLVAEYDAAPPVADEDESRRRRILPVHERTDEIVLELLALLGPDLGKSGERILGRVAAEAPGWLAPAVEEPFTGQALASYRKGFLAELTEAYYLKLNPTHAGMPEDGIRWHRPRSAGFETPHASWLRGPFMPLLQSDFPNGFAVINRMLNHAAHARARSLARLDQRRGMRDSDDLGPYWTHLEIAGSRRLYVGDDHVWLWYRGTGVGPYPCMSALQALERWCDQLIKLGVPIKNLIAFLLEDCQNLAMVGLVVGLLVRHFEDADDLLHPYFSEPLIWHLEFNRVVHEHAGLRGASSEGLSHPERRKWSLRDAAFLAALHAPDDRAEALRNLSERLVRNAQSWLDPTVSHDPSEGYAGLQSTADLTAVRAWASSLDPDNIEMHREEDGLHISTSPPQDVLEALNEGAEDHERGQEATRLLFRYHPGKEAAEPPEPDDLKNDLATARELLEDPPASGVERPWDTASMIAAAALEAHLLRGVDFPQDVLVFATETLLHVGEGATWPRQYEFEGTFYEAAADRSAARTLPLLIVPAASSLRGITGGKTGKATFDRAARAIFNLAKAIADEARLHLARGLDHVWNAPCTGKFHCPHHNLAWRAILETMRGCILSDWNPYTAERDLLSLRRPSARSLAKVQGERIYLPRLDAAIRSLGPAAIANNCRSRRARKLLLGLLDAQRRCLLSHPHPDLDGRDSHTLVSARTLLTLAEYGDDSALFTHVDAYADSSSLITKLLEALSAVAEETVGRAATAQRVWPRLVRHVIELNASGRGCFGGSYGASAVAALVPRAAGEVHYLYRELEGEPITWWSPLSLRPEVEAWLVVAKGSRECIDRLIGFLEVVSQEEQVRVGLAWVAKLALFRPDLSVRSFLLAEWLIAVRETADDAEQSAAWQEIADALVVAGDLRLAPYSA